MDPGFDARPRARGRASRRPTSPTRCRSREATDDATAFLSPDDQLSADGGFATVAAGTGRARSRRSRADAFEPAGDRREAAGAQAAEDAAGDRRLDGPAAGRQARRRAGRPRREGHARGEARHRHLEDVPGRLGPALDAAGASKVKPDAVVVFIGANEGFPMKGAGGREVECCGADWAALYANRARRMAATYRQNGARARLLDHDPDRPRREPARRSPAWSTRPCASPCSRGRARSA